MRVVYSPAHAGHAPEFETEAGVPIPIFERPERAEVIRTALESDTGFEFTEPIDHGRGPIDAVHDRGLIEYLEGAWIASRGQGNAGAIVPDTMAHFALRESMGTGREPAALEARRGYFCFDTATPIVEATYAAARGAVDVALTAVDLVLEDEPMSYGLCRPPGHHAARSVCGGYCYLNNAAIAAEHVVAKTGERVAILDVDYHHGNGTQQIFYRRADVLFVSLHADPNRAYPYFTGFEDERGAGPGEGANLNYPLPEGCDGSQFFEALSNGLEAVAAFGATVTIVSMGVDTSLDDPIADFALTPADQHEMGRRIAGACPRLVILQEGGYDIAALGENVLTWLRGAEGRGHAGRGIGSSADGESPV